MPHDARYPGPDAERVGIGLSAGTLSRVESRDNVTSRLPVKVQHVPLRRGVSFGQEGPVGVGPIQMAALRPHAPATA